MSLGSMSSPEPRWWATELEQSPNPGLLRVSAVPRQHQSRPGSTRRPGPGVCRDTRAQEQTRTLSLNLVGPARPAQAENEISLRRKKELGRQQPGYQTVTGDTGCYDICDPVLTYHQPDTGPIASAQPLSGGGALIRCKVLICRINTGLKLLK